MSIKPVKVLKIFIDETQKYKGQAMYHAIVLKLKELGIAGATVIRGVEGYGSDSILHRARVLELSADLPIVIEAIDIQEKIAAAVPEITKIVHKGLVVTLDADAHFHSLNQ